MSLPLWQGNTYTVDASGQTEQGALWRVPKKSRICTNVSAQTARRLTVARLATKKTPFVTLPICIKRLIALPSNAHKQRDFLADIMTRITFCRLEKIRTKFVASCWKLVTYGVLVIVGVRVAVGQKDWFWDPPSYCLAFPNNVIPESVRQYYLFEIAYYLFSVGYIFYEPQLKDRTQMVTHHMVTLVLLISSYLGNVTKYGAVIMLLHDIADPVMEMAKLAHYVGHKSLSNAIFLVFAGVFIVSRDYVFPVHIVSATWIGSKDKYSFYWPTLFCLCSLCLMHLIWSAMIMRMVKDAIFEKGIKGDIREDAVSVES